jgi:hypothetical protein
VKTDVRGEQIRREVAVAAEREEVAEGKAVQ